MLMKKILLAVFAVAALMASCQKSNQEKADALVGEEMKKILYFPDSYEAVETVLDSAFSPLDDPALYEKTLKMTEHLKNLTQLDERMKIDKSTMAIYSGPYQTAYDRDKCNEAKEEYVNASEEKKKSLEAVTNISNEIKAKYANVHKFIGFKAQHTYRAKNNAGNTLIGKIEFIFDKDLTHVVAQYDMDSEEYQSVQYLYKMMKGEE